MIIRAMGVGVAASVALAALAGTSDARQTSGEKIVITAFAVNMSNIGSGGSTVVDITINRWTTAEERAQIITTMLEKGSEALLSALQKTPSHGRFRIPGLVGPDPHQLRLGYDLHYAWQTAQPEGGRRIVIATDRYIGFEEARAQPRTIDYPFTLFEIRSTRTARAKEEWQSPRRSTSTRARTPSSWKTTPASPCACRISRSKLAEIGQQEEGVRRAPLS